ncbi:S10 family peptidase [Mucilaginibacter sp. X4EP1]|uniref:S10 family peptidase n=1 Tax=Mucilaginibacter sp. X4EP1 TaxID=2723092 RepID=UPI002168A965|nr:carboxypeptidase [Mucilaginibacter sp. X4EP1]MCS3815878.1 carboxypeptidase C (cathepsin A) [Mucilaginibacter sp. X4EP1]
MKKTFILFSIVFFIADGVLAQTATPAKNINPITKSRILQADSSVVTKHQVTIKGKTIPYTATAGSIPVWDADGRPIAGIFYTYFERDDVSDKSNRPLVISFNGGPGSPSAWMEIGYTGPVLLNVDDEGYPIQPYGISENKNSILDVADIVYVDPVNTGYSRIVDKNTSGSKFFGVNEDIKYLAAWINTFVTRKNRWASPKFLIGESYGTNRVAGLALELQNAQGMFFNGVILVSTTDLGIGRDGPVQAALKLPYFTAAAWYYGMLSPDLQQKDLLAILPEVEDFALNILLPAFSKGGFIDDAEKQQLAAKIAHYSGLPEKLILDNNLDVSRNLFRKALLRDKGYTIGRLDSRYKGIDRQAGGDAPEYPAEALAWMHAFTPAINIYLRNDLNYKTDLKYDMAADVSPWDDDNDHTGENLRQAIAQNPSLHLLIQSGYFDGSCDYLDSKYTLWQLDPSGKLKDRLKWIGYKSGHMIYMRKDVLPLATEDLRKFIQESLPKPGEPAKY